MNDMSLAVDYFLIRDRVGRELAMPSEPITWTERQLNDVHQCIRDGFRQCYNPPAVDEFGPHQWSFMWPTLSLTTVADVRWYPMLDGFSGQLMGAGGITYSSTDNKFTPIDITSDWHLRWLENSEATRTGYPACASVRPISDQGETPQRWEMGFHPTPDAAYQFEYQCHMEPYMISEERPHPLGGESHGQMLLYACLAAAEVWEYGRQGEHFNRFVEQLKSDIQKDANRGPTTIGYGHTHRRGGSRDLPFYGRHSAGLNTRAVTYNGTTWD